MNTTDWATIGAYQQDVHDLETQVALLATAVPTAAPATPVVPFAEAWSVSIGGITRAASYPSSSAQAGDSLTIEARGVFIAVRLEVTNESLMPVNRFPWWTLRLRDDAGRTFTPQEEATDAYAAGEGAIGRPETYQPGLVYDEAVVFDVPAEATGLALRSADNSLRLRLLANRSRPPTATEPPPSPTARTPPASTAMPVADATQQAATATVTTVPATTAPPVSPIPPTPAISTPTPWLIPTSSALPPPPVAPNPTAPTSTPLPTATPPPPATPTPSPMATATPFP
ncbi:MAG: hypothetical protein H0U10_00465, partial [Chloroflexia bacterium]|nr:hypothetical protein [Chloroflexia bacterium]